MLLKIDTQSFMGAGRVGIRPSVLKDLNRVVILSGPNGGGKSRFLNLLTEAQQAAQPNFSASSGKFVGRIAAS